MCADRELVWKALSDPTRRAVLEALRHGPGTTGALAAAFPISRIAVMRHLSVLEGAGLISSEKRGRERWHYLNPVPLVTALREWLDPLSERLGESLLDLKSAVEGRMAEPVIDLRAEVEIDAPPEQVYAAITERPGAWWSRSFLSGRAIGLRLDPALGGHLVEQWDEGGKLLATVTALAPSELVTLSGAFHLGAGHGVAELTLTPAGAKTTVTLAFTAFGPVDPTLAEQFPNGWRTLIGVNLKEHVETGRVVGIDRKEH